jgi:5-methylcytosine-specific restriction protein A
MKRNPPWTRDELILALELYFRVNPSHTSENNPEIQELSQVLNSLPIHATSDLRQNFRNPTGVYMKLCNFLRLDPSYKGEGLKAGSKLDSEVWNEFVGQTDRLIEVSKAIRSGSDELGTPRTEEQETELLSEDEEFAEGKVLSRLHKLRERNPSAVRMKKRAILEKTGALRCEVCDFDFHKVYGAIGKAFAECHHILPLSQIKAGAHTKLSDLAIVCANCHRMLHRARPWLSVNDFKKVLRPL